MIEICKKYEDKGVLPDDVRIDAGGDTEENDLQNRFTAYLKAQVMLPVRTLAKTKGALLK